LLSYDIIVVRCGTHADLWLTATFPLLWDLAASFDEAVRAQNLSLFLRHHRRLTFALTGACNIVVVCIMLLLGKQCETITRSFLRLHCRLSFALTGACDFIVVLRHHCRSLRHSCRLVANCHLRPTPVGSCCFIRRSSERPKLISILEV
jgi:hypothetical protein